ncbi:MAG: hypothetical protein RI909_2130 [Bacteroidota bacterium]|jgi:hypothetical protein
MPVSIKSPMLQNLRFAFLLGTLFMPLVMVILMSDPSNSFWLDMVIAWVLLMLASLLLKVFTHFKQKAGNTMTGWWKKNKKKTEPAPDPVMERAASMPYLPTGFIHEVGELAFVGEIISMGFGLLPAIPVLMAISYYFPGFKDILGGRLVAAIFGAISIPWILFLEKRYAIKLTSPLFGIPLKWLLIPLFIFLLFYGDPNK